MSVALEKHLSTRPINLHFILKNKLSLYRVLFPLFAITIHCFHELIGICLCCSFYLPVISVSHLSYSLAFSQRSVLGETPVRRGSWGTASRGGRVSRRCSALLGTGVGGRPSQWMHLLWYPNDAWASRVLIQNHQTLHGHPDVHSLQPHRI